MGASIAWESGNGAGGRRASWLLLLGVSALLHLPLLYWLGKGLANRAWPSPVETLRVDLLPAAPAGPAPSKLATGEEGGGARAASPVAAQPAQQAQVSATASPAAEFDAMAAVQRALGMAREIGRGAGAASRQPLPVPAANLRAAEPHHAKPSPLDPLQPGETRYSDGRMKVVDQWGRVSCVKEPADFVYGQRGEVVPRMAINTNCP